MPYSLYRVSDGAGDSGPMCNIFRHVDGILETEQGVRPRLGWGVQVGSPYSRTFSAQDWWACTTVTEIIEDTSTMMRFKTRNSEYVWKCN